DQRTDPVACSMQHLAALARLATKAAQRHAVLWIVTRDAQQPAPSGEAAGTIGAALWGFGRVLVNEMPHLSVRLLDLPITIAVADCLRLIADELADEGSETEIVWTPQGRHVLRLRRGLRPRWADASDVLTLASTQPGGLDSLGWEVREPRQVGPGEVEI